MVNLAILSILKVLMTSFSTMLFILMILPVIVQLVLNVIIGMINNYSRMDIRPIINIAFFPGALIRLTLMFFLLTVRGWELGSGYGTQVGLNSPTSTGASYFKGFRFYMIPPNREMSFWDTIAFSLIGYLTWVFVLVYVLYYPQVMLFMTYIWGTEMASGVYFFILISLLFGGMPVPEETLAPIFWIISSKPHLVLLTLISLLGAALITGIYGGIYGELYFMVLFGAGLVRDRIDSKKYKQLTGEDILDDILEFEHIAFV